MWFVWGVELELAVIYGQHFSTSLPHILRGQTVHRVVTPPPECLGQRRRPYQMFLLINITQKKKKIHQNIITFSKSKCLFYTPVGRSWRKSCLQRCKHSNLTTAQLKTLTSPWYSNQSDLMNLYILLIWHRGACKAPQMMFSSVSPAIQNTFNCLFTFLTSASRYESHAIQTVNMLSGP